MDITNSKSIESKIDNIISSLTIEEKVAMCHAQSKFSSPGVERLGIPNGCLTGRMEFAEKLMG
jgi:beta-glucosidase